MTAGKRDRQVTLQRKSLQPSPDGFNDIEVWADVKTVWAEVMHASEDIATAVDTARHFEILTARTLYMADIDLSDRISYEGEAYEIRGMREIGRRAGLELKLKAWVD